MPIKVAIVEDEEGIREGLASLIQRSPVFKLVGSYPNGELALSEIPGTKAEVVLMDINLPGMDGVECVRRLKLAAPGLQVVMNTVYEDSERLFKSLMAGASGYLLKRTAPDRLLEALHEVHQGGSPFTPQLARRVVQFFQQRGVGDSQLEQLTPREKQVLEQLAKGYRYKEIVDNLGISLDTVRSYVRAIYEKLHVHSRTEAVVKYLQRG